MEASTSTPLRRPAALVDGFALCRIRELLDHVAPHCPAGLIDAAAWSRLQTLPAALPAASSVGAFECRLEAGAPRIDFEVCVRATGGGRTALGAGLEDLERSIPAANAGWRRTLAFLREWTDPASMLGERIPVVWLEFDLDPSAEVNSAPFVVITLERDTPNASALAAQTVSALERALRLLSGGGVDPAARRTLARCVRRLPPGGRLLHVALRPAGEVDILRAIVKVPCANIADYLSCVDWPGSRTDLQNWLATSCQATPSPSLNLDLGARVGPRVGIEYYFTGAPAIDLRWRALFDALEAAGACTAERRAQLETWPSCSDPAPNGKLLRVDRALLLKVVYQTGAALRAKSYLPFSARLNLR